MRAVTRWWLQWSVALLYRLGQFSTVPGSDVILYCVQCEELRAAAAVLALVDILTAHLGSVVSLDVVGLADLQRVLLPTEAAVILLVTVWVFAELVLDGQGDGLEALLADVAAVPGRGLAGRLAGGGAGAGGGPGRRRHPRHPPLHVYRAVSVQSEVLDSTQYGIEPAG